MTWRTLESSSAQQARKRAKTRARKLAKLAREKSKKSLFSVGAPYIIYKISIQHLASDAKEECSLDNEQIVNTAQAAPPSAPPASYQTLILAKNYVILQLVEIVTS